MTFQKRINRLLLFSAVSLFLWVSIQPAAAQVPRKFAKITLQNLEGKWFSGGDMAVNDINVFYFLAPDCPLCINYSRNINLLAEEYEGKKVGFFGVFPGKFYSEEEIKEYLSTYKVPIEVILDPDYELAKTLKARITPEVFVLDSRGKVKYQGKIDNWIVRLGKKRTIVTEHYLSDAIEAMLEGKDVPVTSTEAVGCLIEYR